MSVLLSLNSSDAPTRKPPASPHAHTSTEKPEPRAESKRPPSELPVALTTLFQLCCSCNTGKSFDELFHESRKIRQVLDRHIITRPPFIRSQLSENRQGKVPKLMEWLVENGVDCSKVEVFSREDGELGLRATQAVPRGQTFISVPRPLILAADDCLESEVGDLVRADPLVSSMPNVQLAFYLISQFYKPASFHRPYLDILPRTHANAVYFELRDLEALRGTSCYTEAFSLWKSVVRQYAYLHLMLLRNPLAKRFGFLERFCFDDYRWAVATVMTRGNNLPVVRGNRTTTSIALIPLIDMCNHVASTPSIDYDLVDRRCNCIAVDDNPQGSELCVFYGVRTNALFVLHNGFFYETNEHDQIDICDEANPSTTLDEIKVNLLQNIAGETNFIGFQLPFTDGKQLACLRIRYASSSDLDQIKSCPIEDILLRLADPNQPLSVENDARVGRALRNAILRITSTHTTTIAQDNDELLKPLTPCLQLCIRLRKAEKELLARSLLQIDASLPS